MRLYVISFPKKHGCFIFDHQSHGSVGCPRSIFILLKYCLEKMIQCCICIVLRILSWYLLLWQTVLLAIANLPHFVLY